MSASGQTLQVVFSDAPGQVRLAGSAVLGSAAAGITGVAAKEAAYGEIMVQARGGAFSALTDRLFTYDHVADSKDPAAAA